MRKIIKAAALMILTALLMGTAVRADSDTYNVLLIGVDRRDDSWEGNSDVMMLATINYDKETIFLTSFLRDLYADIPGIGVSKLNAACANGGAELCVETIRQNYQVQIDNYALVDFGSMKDIVDTFGGVDIEVTEDEREVANDYIAVMCAADGVPAEEHLITESGLVHLDGYQAVGYARNRYSGNTYDFGRTQRQREIITKLFEKMADEGAAGISGKLLQILPHVETDITPLTVLELLPKIQQVIDFEIEEQHIPYDNQYYSENEILIPTDMQATIDQLRATIY